MTVLDIKQTKSGWVGAHVFTKSNLADKPKYLGTFSNNVIESLTKTKGDQEPVYAKGTRPSEIAIVDTIRGAPSLGELGLRERVRPETFNYLERVYKTDCAIVWLLKIDDCGNLDDRNSFQSFFIVDTSKLNNIDLENIQTPLDGTEAMFEMSGTFSLTTWERLVPIKFAAYAESTVLAEVLDIIYADEISCGTCAPASNGCQQVYALTRANTGSPGLSSQLAYTLNGGSTWSTKDIAPFGGLSGNRLVSVGQYLVVISEADASWAYVEKDTISTDAFTQVDTGLEAGGAPRAIYAANPNLVFIGGAGGYIYKSDDITADVEVVHDASITTQNSNDIHGNGQVIVSVHDNNVVLVSTNGGVSFASITGSVEVGANLTAVWVRSAFQWYIGTNTGKLWYTEDGGVTFTQRALPNQANLSVVNDIKFSDELNEVGAIAVQTLTAGYVYRTFTGGREWYQNTAISGLNATGTTNTRINAIALCGLNEIAAGGLESGSTDGLIVIAKGN